MKIYDKNKQPVFHTTKTQFMFPLITIDFHKNNGVNIMVGGEKRELSEYWFTGEFYSQLEYDNFMADFCQKNGVEKTPLLSDFNNNN